MDKGHRNKSLKKIQIYNLKRKVKSVKNSCAEQYLKPKGSKKKGTLIAKIAYSITQGHRLSIQKLALLYG